ncbi:MAG: hypothetical protein GEU88_03210 [Solirubrobacterales bacterium]|nr:hypothetical protein [Solirubrobacterales bacterium]
MSLRAWAASLWAVDADGLLRALVLRPVALRAPVLRLLVPRALALRPPVLRLPVVGLELLLLVGILGT